MCVCVCVGIGKALKPPHSNMPALFLALLCSDAGVKYRLISSNKSWSGGLGMRLTQSIMAGGPFGKVLFTSLTNMVSTRPVDRQRNQPLASRNDRHPLPSGEAHEHSNAESIT